MLYRPIREYLDQAMLAVKEFNTVQELINLLPEYVNRKNPYLEFVSQGFDNRIGWNSWLVSVDGEAVGHTDGIPLFPSQEIAENVLQVGVYLKSI
jgi:hypothetical protein